jgi:hypothetical protein
MLKKSPNFILSENQFSTYPHGSERVLARLGGWVEYHASGACFTCGLAREGARLGTPGVGGCNSRPF